MTLLLVALIPKDRPELRAGVALYAVLLVVAFAVPTPMGGNAVRLGALAAGAVAVAALVPRRRVALLLIAPALLYWQWYAPADDWVHASEDPAAHAGYYTGLLGFLERQRGPLRLEIPFSDNHWESAFVAPRFALARGWERQFDRKVNPIFYKGKLTPERYRNWLQDNAVTFVALGSAPIDYSAATEARLIRSGLPFLRPVWSDRHWRVYAVTPRPPLAEGAKVTQVDSDAVELSVPRAGRVLLKMRYTPYWRIESGSGCVAPSGQWTELSVRRAGTVRLVTGFAVDRIRSRAPRCTDDGAGVSRR
jgi:hypothetical protein